ncbi:hypothetical protein [Prevotella sp. tf2-5]|uniref:hypothetical protein n=1 Tax=Prevotella sp. tf2-5 TaxID=1761889 RepID=UPI0008E26F2E|nr:hypothetical protein [Prevotella sp. tf2-5]SFO93784.1 hypothetical protein SAMN04487852_11112 [Prevotella sp. tf2-5]
MKNDVNEHVRLYPDGKYRWVYEVNMLTNFSILFDVLKVLGISMGILVLLFVVIAVFDGDWDVDMLIGMASTLGIVALVMLVLGLIGYFVYAAISGWKYAVLFIMDEKEVVHQQMPNTVKKGQLIGALTILAGLASGRPGAVGTGVLAQSRLSMTSTLAHVERLVSCRRMNLIKVNERFEKNRVYVNTEDFDFVYDYLLTHCTHLKFSK